MTDTVRGTNFGNWLVLEKWMKPDLFASSGTEDETWLCRKEKPDALRALLKEHRDTYITEDDFAYVASLGLNFVPVLLQKRAQCIGLFLSAEPGFIFRAGRGEKIRLHPLFQHEPVPEVRSSDVFDNILLLFTCISV